MLLRNEGEQQQVVLPTMRDHSEAVLVVLRSVLVLERKDVRLRK
jgi:hypothetical protein